MENAKNKLFFCISYLFSGVFLHFSEKRSEQKKVAFFAFIFWFPFEFALCFRFFQLHFLHPLGNLVLRLLFPIFSLLFLLLLFKQHLG